MDKIEVLKQILDITKNTIKIISDASDDIEEDGKYAYIVLCDENLMGKKGSACMEGVLSGKGAKIRNMVYNLCHDDKDIGKLFLEASLTAFIDRGFKDKKFVNDILKQINADPEQ